MHFAGKPGIITQSDCLISMIQILQLVPSSESGQILAWLVVEGMMLKIPLDVPRVFYINSTAPIKQELKEEFPGKYVNKTLPHGKHSYYLYEVLLVLMFSSNNMIYDQYSFMRGFGFNMNLICTPDNRFQLMRRGLGQ